MATLVERLRRVVPPRDIPRTTVIFDTCWLTHLAQEDYATFTADGRAGNCILTPGVERELHKRGGEKNAPLMTDALRQFIYHQLQLEKRGHNPTPEEIARFTNLWKQNQGYKKQPISNPDIEQLALGVNCATRDMPVVFCTDDIHLVSVVRRLRRDNPVNYSSHYYQ